MASTAVSEHQLSRPGVARVTYHHGDLKRELVATAARLIEEPGASPEVSLRRVAREIGVSHVATYRHFASKADLLSAVVDRWITTLCERMLRAAASETAPRQRIDKMLEAWVQFALDVPVRFRMMAERHRDPTRPMGLSVLVDEILRGQRDGSLRAGDPSRIGRTLLLATYGYVEVALDGRLTRVSAPLEELLAPALDGIVARR